MSNRTIVISALTRDELDKLGKFIKVAVWLTHLLQYPDGDYVNLRVSKHSTMRDEVAERDERIYVRARQLNAVVWLSLRS